MLFVFNLSAVPIPSGGGGNYQEDLKLNPNPGVLPERGMVTTRIDRRINSTIEFYYILLEI